MEIADKSTVSLDPKLDQVQNRFMWQNNLLKFYLEHKIDDAIDYCDELIEEVGSILPAEH